MIKAVYRRPAKPSTLTVKRRDGAPPRALDPLPAVLSVNRETECHVTPDHVAEYMVDVLEAPRDCRVLEPQSGTGQLVNALIDSGHSPAAMTMVERSYELCQLLSKRFSPLSMNTPIHKCFLDYANEERGNIEYPRIIMNSPFKKVKSHFSAALSLLGHAGHKDAILVALVPITFEHDEAGLIDILPNDTFFAAAVNTKIIRIVR